ncbi:MAG TPA: Ig-like domain-containing protein [Acidimicrobiales bacterium]|nr:Ig-like domain-containing protein [Acidimicrobiales bacterium]
MRVGVVVVIALALLAGGTVPARAHHVPPPEGEAAGSGKFAGTEIVQDEVLLAQAMCFATARSVFGLRAAGTFHGRTPGGAEVVYSAPLPAGGVLSRDGALSWEIENTQPYYHGPNGTYGTQACNPAAANTPVPAQVRVFTADHVFRLDEGGNQVPCVGEGSFARDQEAKFHAAWTLTEPCTVVGNDAGNPGQGVAPVGTQLTQTGLHGACFAESCPSNIRGDFAQFHPLTGFHLGISAPTPGAAGDTVSVAARVSFDGVAVPGAAVSFSVVGPAPAPAGGAGTTDTDGRTAFTFTPATPGDYTVSAAATSASHPGLTATDTFTVAVTPRLATMALTGPLTPIVGDDVAMVAKVSQKGETALTYGVVVSWTVTGPGQATPASGTAVTDGNGAGFSFRVDRAGAYTVTATATHDGQYLSATAAVNARVSTVRQAATLDLPADENGHMASVVDPTGRYAYFAQYGKVVKVDLDTFQRVGALTLATGDTPTSAVMDPAGRYAYFGTSNGRVVKVDLNTFEQVGVIILEPGENNLNSAAIDPAGAYAYFAGGPTSGSTSVGRLAKIDLSTFERVGAIATNPGEIIKATVVDPAGDFAYIGVLGQGNGGVVKVDLATFERTDTLRPNNGAIASMVIDPSGNFAYLGTKAPAAIKIDLATFQLVGSVSGFPDPNGLKSAMIDPAGDFAYFAGGGYHLGTPGNPGVVTKVDLDPFEVVENRPLETVQTIGTAVIDPQGAYAYLGGTTNTAGPTPVPGDDVPPKLIKVALTRAPKAALVAAGDAYATDYGTPLSVPAPGVVANDADTEDNDALTAHDATDPAHGRVALSPDGSFTYTPDAGWSGTDTFTYAASDGRDFSPRTTVSIVVAPAPEGVQTVSGGAFGFSTNVSLFAGPAEQRGPRPAVTLAPNGGDHSATDPDGDVGQYGPAMIFESHGPLTVSTEGTTGSNGSSVASASVKDISDNDPFHAHAPDGEASSTCTATEAGLSASSRIVNGRLVVHTDPDGNPTEEITFPPSWDPAPNTTYEGALDNVGDRWRIVFNEQIVSPDSITVNAVHLYLLGPIAVGDMVIGQSRCGVEVPDPNAAPVAADDTYSVRGTQPLVIGPAGVLANDTDPDGQPLSASILAPIRPPASGGGAWTFPGQPANGTLALGHDGSFTYTANDGFTGSDSFTYVASDSRGKSDPATVTIAVTAAVRKAVADFDGNGTSDRSVFRNGAWYAEGQATAYFGIAGDIAVPGDYDGNATTERAVYRDGAWISEAGTAYLGLAGDVPVPADYNGDGTTDRAVFRPLVGAWYIEGQAPVFHGADGDIPVPGDYDGDGDAEVAIFRPEVGGWYIAGQATQWIGLSGDIPVPGDYDGNGTTDRGIFRPEVGGWYIEGQATQWIGLSGDVPVPGDYDGNASTDRGIWRSGVGGWYVEGAAPVFLGIAGDVPLPLPQAIYRAFF